MSHKFTAIIPNYNSASWLPKAIQSLLEQTEPFNEIVIVDDGSTDHSLALIQELTDKYPQIRLIKHDINQGVIAALNHGIEQATGDYILLGAADDWYHSDMVKESKEILDQYPGIGFVCGDAIIQHYDYKPFSRMLPYPANSLMTPEEFKNFARNHYTGFNAGGGMLMNRKAVIEAGRLSSSLRWHADWLLYFVLAFKYGFYYTNKIFITINMRKESYSQGKKLLATQRNIIINTIKIYRQQYTELWQAFKQAALLPHYSPAYIPWFLIERSCRQFVSLKLIWKLMINNSMVTKIGRLFPYRVILGVRKWLNT